MKKNNIISRLRFKLIAVSMAVTLVILGLIVGGINFINYKKIIDNADRTIDYLAELNMDRLTEMRKGILIHLMKVFPRK